MNSKKLKRSLSILLSLSMALSLHTSSFAADLTAADEIDTPAQIHMDTANEEGNSLSNEGDQANEEASTENAADSGQTTDPADSANSEDPENPGTTADPEVPETPAVPETPGTTTDPEAPDGATDPDDSNPEQPTPPSGETCEHDWQITSVIKPMNCATNTNGIHFVTCSKCKETDYQTVSAAHTPGDSSIQTEATCVENGIREITCTVCNNLYEEEIPATGEHDYQQAKTDATCDAPATITWACSMCNAVDSDRTTTEGSALGHADDNEYKRVLTEATCTTDGREFVRCSRCGRTEIHTIPSAGGHTWNSTPEHIASTCKEQGKNVYQCSVCGETDAARIETIPIETEPLKEHTPKTLEAIAPTCSAAGKTEGSVCEVCGDTLTAQEEIPLDPDAHVYGDTYTTIKAATCTTPGLGLYTCSACKNPSYITLTSSHTWSEEGETAQSPTCTENGEIIYTCTNDNCPGAKGDGSDSATGTNDAGKAIKAEPIPASGHKWDNGTETTAPTCGAAGVKTYTCTNDNCPGAKGDGSDDATGTNDAGEAIKAEPIPATGQHTYINSRTEATCTMPAMVGQVCSVCNKVGQDAQPEEGSSPLGHDWDEGVVTTPAACGTTGEKVRTCTRENCPGAAENDDEATGTDANGKAIKTETIDALAHNYQMTEITAATCTSPAMQQEKCQLCQEPKPDTQPEAVPDSQPLGHQWSENGTVTTPVSCTTDGEETFTCERSGCPGHTDGDTTDATGENADGKAIKAVPIPKGHDWDEGVETTAATCTTEGEKTFTCQREQCPGHTDGDTTDATGENADGKAIKTETVQKTPHIYEQRNIAATCTEKAHIGYYCTACDALQPGTTPEKYGELAAHEYEVNTEESTGATCTQPGTKVEECKNCSDRKTTELPAEHTWSDWTVTQKATCTSSGSKYRYCTVCTPTITDTEGTPGYEAVEITTDGHQFDDGVITQEGNCGTNEMTTYNCTVTATDEREGCTHSKTEMTAPATGEHDYEDKMISATCTEPMKIGQVCKVCRMENKMTEFGDPAGHQYTETIDTPATCLTAGQKTLTCSVCSDSHTEAIAALGHDIEAEYVAPSCTESGKSIETCKRTGCDYQNTRVLEAIDPALGHDFVDVAEVPATCAAPGKTAGTQCSRCDEATGMEEIPIRTDDDAHQWELTETLTTETCITNGAGRYTCEVCNATKLGTIPGAHLYGEPEIVSATCTKDGSKTVTCTRCGDSDVTVLTKSGHNLDAGIKTTEETCGTDGVLLQTCQNEWCVDGEDGGRYTKTSSIPATGEHHYQYTIIPAACTTPEKAGSFCTACNTPEKAADIIEIGEPLGHEWNAGVETTPASCEEPGVKTFACTREDCVETRTEEIEKLGHDFQSVYEAPTCQHGGQSVETCKRDGCTYSNTKDLSKIPGEEKLPHTPVEVAEVPATCTAPGTTAGTRCSVCQETISGIETIPVSTDDSAHEWELSSTMQEATCTVPGYGRYDCKNCDEYKFAEIAASHTWGEPETIPSTCEEDGSITETCTRCGETQITTLSKTGHKYKSTVTKEATCNEDGVRTYICQNLGCENRYTESIPATGQHNYQATVLPPTCTEPEKVGEFCTVCGAQKGEITEVGKPLGHEWNEGETTTPATCTEDGTMTFTCTRKDCGTTRTEEIKKLGHDYQVTGSVDATCEENGKSILTCSRCRDEMITDLGDFEPATGHTPVQGVCQVCQKVLASTSTNAATLQEDGTNKIVFTNHITVDLASTTIVEMGILYRTSATSDPALLTLGNVGSNGVRVKKTEEGQISGSTTGFSFKFNVSTQVTRALSARGYIVVENKDGSRETIYGDVLNGCYNDFLAQP